MENQYGITTKNKYELFLDEDQDPLDILRAHEEECKNKKKDEGGKSKKDSKNEKAKSAGKSKKDSKNKAPVPEQKTKGLDQNANKKDGEFYFVPWFDHLQKYFQLNIEHVNKCAFRWGRCTCVKIIYCLFFTCQVCLLCCHVS